MVIQRYVAPLAKGGSISLCEMWGVIVVKQPTSLSFGVVKK